jgi:hypothetical protein
MSRTILASGDAFSGSWQGFFPACARPEIAAIGLPSVMPPMGIEIDAEDPERVKLFSHSRASLCTRDSPELAENSFLAGHEGAG